MRVQVIVAERAMKAAREAILELIRKDVGLVVGEPRTNGDAAAVIRWADVPCVGRGTQKARMVGTSGQAIGRRVGVTVVGGDSQSTPKTRQEGKVLQVGNLKSCQTGATCVDRLRH